MTTVYFVRHAQSDASVQDPLLRPLTEQGRIIERGTHDELIEKKGKYYQLYTGNFAEEPA